MNDLISRQAAIDTFYELWGTSLTRTVEAIKALPTAQPERKWIPVSKRLPEEPGEYYVTNHLGHVVRYVFNDTASSKEYWRRCAIAWMPMPEPYQESIEERRTDD